MTQKPTIRGICETVLYSDDLAKSQTFFEGFLDLRLTRDGPGMLVFEAGTAQVLIVFLRGWCETDKPFNNSFIPGHTAKGPAHMAFHISVADYDGWKAAFEEENIPIVSEVVWPRGGRALYFNDPDGNVLELQTPGHWDNF